MRETRIFGTAFAAALASLLGLGPGAAADMGTPQSYQADPAGDDVLPAWLVRFKLRQSGYQDIAEVETAADGFAVDAHDRWGRRVRLFIDPRSGEIVPRAGFGLAHLRPADLPSHLEALGYRFVATAAYRDGHYKVVVHDAAGTERRLNVDSFTGAVWS